MAITKVVVDSVEIEVEMLTVSFCVLVSLGCGVDGAKFVGSCDGFVFFLCGMFVVISDLGQSLRPLSSYRFWVFSVLGLCSSCACF